MNKYLDVRALKVTQAEKIPLYSFFLRGTEILEVSEISRIKRDDAGNLLGYQRGEVSKHISEIVDYLDSGNVLFPNAILLAMSSDVKFKQSRGPKVGAHVTESGVISLPIGEKSQKAWIVDGQQRTTALSIAKNKDLLVPVTAFVTDDFEIHRAQFLLVNKVKPLPRGLINELLPEVNTTLPLSMSISKLPSLLCNVLNEDPGSPFIGLIQRETTKNKKETPIVDTSLIHIIRISLNNPHGCLYQYRNLATGETDQESIKKTIYLFWSEVKNAFPEGWGISSRQSRLMHGVGIKSMGVLMDRIMANLHPDDPNTRVQVKAYLDKLKPYCAWTSGRWDILEGVPWNSLQNTPTDIKRLSNALVRAYMLFE